MKPEDINIIRCDCELKNPFFDSLGTLEGIQAITHMFKCLFCGKEYIVKVIKTS